MAYCTDEDLFITRHGVQDLLIDDFTGYHNNATGEINTDLELRWYRPVAQRKGLDPRVVVFDAAYVRETEILSRAAIYLTLSLIYDYAAIDAAEEFYSKVALRYREMYDTLFKSLLDAGVTYDWSKDGSITADELLQSTRPTILRIERM